MKFKSNDKVITLINKNNIKKGSIGYIVCEFTEPNEAYDVEFYNDKDTAPYGYETYLPNEIKLITK